MTTRITNKESMMALFETWNLSDQKENEMQESFNVPTMNKIILRPNPFQNSINIELGLSQNEHLIIRMTNSKGNIIRLFGWYLLKGTNVTNINDLSNLEAGEYHIDIMNQKGDPIFSETLVKS